MITVCTNFHSERILKTHNVENLLVSPQSYTWSPSGKYAVIHNIDYYADDGSRGIVVLNVQSGHFIEITRDQIIKGKDWGKRDKLNIYNIVWLDSNRFSIIASAAYLGKWQSIDDSDSYIYFTENEILYAYGIEVTGQESYVLSDSCMDTEEADEDSSSDSQQYIYILSSDTCFYIIDLAPQFLSLSHAGRGNTLTYVK